jgi:amino acid adenylation domain-containing protein
MIEQDRSLASGFLRASREFPLRPALEVDGQTLTYVELEGIAASFAATLTKHLPFAEPALTAVFGYRSVTAFAGVLAALFRGHGYVPLNRTFPPERTRLMLQRAGCKAIIVDTASQQQLELILPGIEEKLVLLLPHAEDVDSLAARWPQHVFLKGSDLEPSSPWSDPKVSMDAIAYLLFTSGSTGTPKGVMVSHRNVLHYVNYVTRRYAISEFDRVSQTFDMTFDLSAHDMFVAWERGACVCCLGKKEMIKPGRFIKEAQLSIWFSVPSTAVFMKRFGELKPGLYPELRLSLFCGEALPVDLARAWSDAAPNSVIENLYGPTELTIACTAYRLDGAQSSVECEQGLVPIGVPFDGMEAMIVHEDLTEVDPGDEGELLMSGPQLSLGYWQDEERTARAFLAPPGKTQNYYRTGDRVRRPLPGKPIVYLGRVDNQIQILGHRVELGEIEAVVRKISGVDGVVALGWPVTSSGADGIEVFLQTDRVDVKILQEKLKSALPTYMAPRSIRLLPRFPLNANGKFDRGALINILGKAP